MSNPSKRSIPAWQQKENTQSSDATPNTQTTDASIDSHAELLEHARGFLKNDAIRLATREKKQAFLEKKGLALDDIQTLLDEEQSVTEDKEPELKTVHDSNIASISEEEPTKSESKEVVVATETNMPPPPRDIPPIITYPEFLLKPQKPPPLVTVDRLLNAVYAIAGVTALSYGASKYIVEPMVSILTEARHDLAGTTFDHLTKFNDKLITTVSHVPYIPSLKLAPKSNHPDHSAEDDTLSVASDPTEFFHRDIATQTSPPLSRSPSSSTLTKNPTTDSASALTAQLSSLTTLSSTLESLLTDLESTSPVGPGFPPSSTTYAALSESVTSLQSTLDKLEHSSNPFRYDHLGGSAASIYQPTDPLTTTTKKGSAAKVDEATKFKAEIRALKGAFLSSRNFPTATRPAAIVGGGMGAIAGYSR